MEFDDLKAKALSLPAEPGVYLMKNKEDAVIYVGKAKKLKNRVSQYFQDTAAHNLKTRLMVSKIHHFDVIVAANEFEALVLECSLIKKYQPKYNILLKDDKGYPYLRLDMKAAYPVLTMVNRPGKDGAVYYGPFGSRGVTQNILDSIFSILQLPKCNKRFPQDVGKGRPCLNYHMDQCAGWCRSQEILDGYKAAMEQVRQLLLGNYKDVADEMRAQMLSAGEALNFELAATLRDRLRAVEALGTKQLVTAGKAVDTDVVGYGATETKACFAVLHFRDGNLIDKDYEIFPAAEDKEQVVSSLVSQYYISRGYAPKTILLPFEMEDSGLLSGVLEENYGRKTVIRVPQRGDAVKLVALAVKNAQEEAERLTNKEDRTNATLQLLGKMLCMDAPRRIESYDISNLSGTDIVAGMVVFDGGVPRRGDYKRFKIEGLSNADDYASMEQVLIRRFGHFLHGDKGFDEKPDLLLIDGGVTHAQTAQRVLDGLGLNFRILGMVKDDRHRTRALVTPGGEEIRIDNNPAIFALIGNIQEETHRFAISYHKKLRSKRLRYSALDAIAGIGPKRKELLLKTFKSLSGIKAAKLPELEQYLPKDAAMAVYEYFHRMKG